jgi:hypothetical protein
MPAEPESFFERIDCCFDPLQALRLCERLKNPGSNQDSLSANISVYQRFKKTDATASVCPSRSEGDTTSPMCINHGFIQAKNIFDQKRVFLHTVDIFG